MKSLLLSLLFCNLIIASYEAATDEEIRQLLERINQQDERITELESQQQKTNQVNV